MDVLLEDDDFAVINKPPNMVVHPSKGHWSGTLTAAISFRFKNLSTVGGQTRPGIVHRLDRDTSGAIIIAKTDDAHSKLSQQFEARTVEKEYWTIVTPAPDRDRDLIDMPIGAHPYQRERKGNSNQSSDQFALPNLCTKSSSDSRALALSWFDRKTGRTHQIRVHMAHVGCPVFCDRLYSGRARVTLGDFTRNEKDNEVLLLGRQALHAHRIQFSHPKTGTRVSCTAPLPADLTSTLEAIRKYRSR